MKRKSDSFLNEVTERINRLKEISEESGLDYTQELVKTLRRLSDISVSNTSQIKYSEDSIDINESNLILQPTNSLFDDSSMDSKVSLITSIKNKNDELQKTCSQKLMELRATTKEFAKSRQGIRFDSPDRKVSSSMQIRDFSKKEGIYSRKESIGNDEMLTQKVDIHRRRSNTQDLSHKSFICDAALNNILGELTQLKSQLTVASTKIIQNNEEIIKQRHESTTLKTQLETLIEKHAKSNSGNSCGCKLF
ncbi:hypothetical protein SteCoe_12306 [Stentor coeruleus]|uniref:Uncharacterized protein n=1 Tax=Stentor coeruleus TaxID=5963 RepID=A0A1R2CB62_9CILI|nr:hypothetical protein SteCoe_12306 [Stentor coeruleus]